jgi:hypothetical protein
MLLSMFHQQYCRVHHVPFCNLFNDADNFDWLDESEVNKLVRMWKEAIVD